MIPDSKCPEPAIKARQVIFSPFKNVRYNSLIILVNLIYSLVDIKIYSSTDINGSCFDIVLTSAAPLFKVVPNIICRFLLKGELSVLL